MEIETEEPPSLILEKLFKGYQKKKHCKVIEKDWNNSGNLEKEELLNEILDIQSMLENTDVETNGCSLRKDGSRCGALEDSIIPQILRFYQARRWCGIDNKGVCSYNKKGKNGKYICSLDY